MADSRHPFTRTMLCSLSKPLALLFIATFFCTFSAYAQEPATGDKGVLVEEWKYAFGSICYRMTHGPSPAVADLGPEVGDGGPDLEIVTGNDEYWANNLAAGEFYCFNSTGQVLWKYNTNNDEARTSPAIADVDGDGDLEIVGGSTSGNMTHLTDHNGERLWRHTAGMYVHASPAIGDLSPGRPGLEIVSASYTSFVYCLDKDGQLIWSYRTADDGPFDYYYWYSFYSQIDSSPTIGDVDGDGDQDVIIGSDNDYVYCFDGPTGKVNWKYKTGYDVRSSAAIADINNDGVMEVFIGSADKKIYCLNGLTGEPIWIYTTSGEVNSSPAIGDVDADGFYEVIVGSNDHQVYCLNAADGTLEWAFATGAQVWSSPALADRNNSTANAIEWGMFQKDAKRSGFYGDSTAGLDIYIGSEDSYLYLLDGKNGELIDRFLANARIRSCPAVADVDGDKKLEVMFIDWSAPGWLWDGSSGDIFWCLEDTAPADTLDPGNLPPSGSIVINGGDAVTTTTAVTLVLSAQDDSAVASMCFSIDGINFTEWEDYTAQKPWTLSLGDGEKTAYVKYMDDMGLESVIYSDPIMLDTSQNLPAVLAFKVRPKTLNMTSQGKKMLAQIHIPGELPLTADDIDLATIKITDNYGNEYTVDILPVGVEGPDGSNNVVMKLDRSEVSGSLLESLEMELGDGNKADVTFTVTGDLFVGTTFSGTSTINLINNG